MNAVLIFSCTSAICYGIRGWHFPMWGMLMVAGVVASTILWRETK